MLLVFPHTTIQPSIVLGGDNPAHLDVILDLLDLLGDPMVILLRQSFHGLQLLLDLLGDLLRDRVPDHYPYRVRHFADV